MSNSANRHETDSLLGYQSVIVDACGLNCPMPLLKMKQALNRMSTGDVMLLKATDAASQKDIAAYIATTSHFLESAQEAEVYLYWVKKA